MTATADAADAVARLGIGEPMPGPTLLVRYFAAAAEAAGVEEERVPVTGDLDDLLAAAVSRHGAPLARVLPACSVLLDGRTTTDRAVPLVGVATVDLLPPFAGG